jgi:hypothetical protein
LQNAKGESPSESTTAPLSPRAQSIASDNLEDTGESSSHDREEESRAPCALPLAAGIATAGIATAAADSSDENGAHAQDEEASQRSQDIAMGDMSSPTMAEGGDMESGETLSSSSEIPHMGEVMSLTLLEESFKELEDDDNDNYIHDLGFPDIEAAGIHSLDDDQYLDDDHYLDDAMNADKEQGDEADEVERLAWTFEMHSRRSNEEARPAESLLARAGKKATHIRLTPRELANLSPREVEDLSEHELQRRDRHIQRQKQWALEEQIWNEKMLRIFWYRLFAIAIVAAITAILLSAVNQGVN